MRVLSVVGARPQFVKAAAVSAALRDHPELDEVLVHTGQHYDEAMSAAFFEELGIPQPHHELHVGSGNHGRQTGLMMDRLEDVVLAEQPDCVLVYGDTNSTLAGALVAAKLRIPLAHVEAGLRSFDRSMPEEINRVVADHVSDHLYCPTAVACGNLADEGITQGVHVVGDVMYDVMLRELDAIDGSNPLRDILKVSGAYVAATIHRPGNTDDPSRFGQIVAGLSRLAADGLPVIWPVHPRSRPKLADYTLPPELHLVPPASYREMVALARDAACVVTDSGGVQKEAYWVSTPCVTVRPSTEWLETVELGWNRLVGADADAIEQAVRIATPGDPARDAYGDGTTSQRIVNLIATLARR